MEKIGLLDNLSYLVNTKFELAVLASQSVEQIFADKNDFNLLNNFKSIIELHDAFIFIEAERIVLELELSNRANSAEETNSIKTALVQLADAQRAYQVVQDTTAYQEGTKTYSTRQREAGLPIDAFREFIKSHTTRLTNRLSAPLPVSEKNLLRQRKENLKVAKETYMALQRKALGLDE